MGLNKIKDKSKKTKKNPIFATCSFNERPQDIYARMAELVDALVSNTSGSNAVPVRSRLRVQKKSESESPERALSFCFTCFLSSLPYILMWESIACSCDIQLYCLVY